MASQAAARSLWIQLAEPESEADGQPRRPGLRPVLNFDFSGHLIPAAKPRRADAEPSGIKAAIIRWLEQQL